VLVVAIDTATPAVTAGVCELRADADPVMLAQRVTVDAKAHAELLTAHVTGALADAGLSMRDMDAIVCGTGPGPFTGLRVGMVTAAALGHALGIPVHGVCSLDAIPPQAGVPHLVVTDARRREVYWAAYDAAHRRTDGPHVQRPADLAARLGELRVECAAGAGARMYAEVLGLPVIEPDYPTVIGLATVATTMHSTEAATAPGTGPGTEAGTAAGTGAAVVLPGTPAPLVPMYLRRPDAAEPGPRKRVLAARDAGP
jgi:tRNA threonylcarbamoyl adenosine modification protein YeaZ